MALDVRLTEAVRLAVYRGFAVSGVQMSTEQIATAVGLPEEQVERALLELERGHHLVRIDDQIVLAHPFASRNFGFSVMSASALWWGGCAWDAFAIPNLVKQGPMLVATTCPACGTAHAWVVDDGAPPAGEQVAHFLVPAQRIWDDVVHACGNQRVFCSTDCVHNWLMREGLEEGSTFSIETLWRLASHWYDGRLDSPYVRRDPEQASEYFAALGALFTVRGVVGVSARVGRALRCSRGSVGNGRGAPGSA